jgi:hypothetical protein
MALALRERSLAALWMTIISHPVKRMTRNLLLMKIGVGPAPDLLGIVVCAHGLAVSPASRGGA